MVMNDSLILFNTTSLPFINRIFTNTSLAHRLLERLTLVNLRHAFYLISPYETAVPTVEEVPNYNVEISAWWLVFLVVEFFILKVSGHDDRFALNDTITSVCAGMLSQCFKFGGRTVALFLYVFIWNNYRLLELPWDSPWTWILCLFFQDFMYYLGHRAVHEAGVFWGLHTIHHSSEYYNFSTALRQAAIQDAGLAIYDVTQALFIPPPIFLVHRYFSEIFQFIMHTSLFDTLGPLGLIFNTPSHHRVHHGRNPYCIDKNYGGVFIIWDKMFGTFESERKDDPPVYGLVTKAATFNQLYLQFYTIWHMLIMKGTMKDKAGTPLFPGVLNKIKAALYPPGWFPGVQIRPFLHWMSMVHPSHGVPQPENPVVKYNPSISIWIKLYLITHFTIFLAVFFHFEFDRSHLSTSEFSIKIAYFVLTMQCFGAFFDKRFYAPQLEILRCIGVISFYIYIIMDHHGPGPHRLFMMSIHFISILIWISFTFIKFVSSKCSSRISDAQRTVTDTKITISTISNGHHSAHTGAKCDKL